MKNGQKFEVVNNFKAIVADSNDEIVEVSKGSVLTKVENGEDYFITYSERFDFNGQLIEFSTYDVEDNLKAI
jgi:hypothetical protein